MIELAVLLFLCYLLGCAVGLGIGALFFKLTAEPCCRSSYDHDKETRPPGFDGGVRKGLS